MGKQSVDKGKRFERELVNVFAEAVPGARVARGYQYRAGSDAPDVDIPGFWVEAKCGARVDVRKALRQAQEASRGRQTPLVVAKEDYQPPVVVLTLADFLNFYRQWYAGRTGANHEG